MEPLNLGRYMLDESIRGPIRNRHRNRRWIVYIELTEVDSYKRSSSELAGTRSNKRRPPKDSDHPKTKTIPRQILSEDRFHPKTDPIRRQIPSKDRSYPKTEVLVQGGEPPCPVRPIVPNTIADELSSQKDRSLLERSGCAEIRIIRQTRGLSVSPEREEWLRHRR
jgi:hypothetical protein